MIFFQRKYYQLLAKYLKNKPKHHIAYVKTQFYLKNNKKLDLDHPREFAEKMQWMRLYAYDTSFKKYIDKYEVRTYIKDTIGEQYLNELIGVYDTVEAIDLETFPEKFVLKATHGSGYNIIVSDRGKFNWTKAKAQLKKFLSQNYYDKYKEIIYKDIQPRIIAEKFLDQLESNYIIDYKLMCFHGVPHYIHVKTFEGDRIKEAYYDMNWQKQTPETVGNNHLKQDIVKPKCFDEMASIATKLSSKFVFVRVDLYEIDNKIYFGELTFLHKGGMKRNYVEPLNKIMGDLIKLPI